MLIKKNSKHILLSVFVSFLSTLAAQALHSFQSDHHCFLTMPRQCSVQLVEHRDQSDADAFHKGGGGKKQMQLGNIISVLCALQNSIFS